MIQLGAYKKFIVALVAAAGVLGAAAADGALTGQEGVAIVSAFLGSLGVYGFRNDPLPE